MPRAVLWLAKLGASNTDRTWGRRTNRNLKHAKKKLRDWRRPAVGLESPRSGSVGPILEPPFESGLSAIPSPMQTTLYVRALKLIEHTNVL